MKHARPLWLLPYNTNFSYWRRLTNILCCLNLMWIHKRPFPLLGFTFFLVTVIIIRSGYLSMNSDYDDHLDLKSKSSWSQNICFWLLWMKMFYLLQKFALLRRQDLKINIIIEIGGILGSQTVSSSDIVVHSWHVWGFECKHMQHFEMQKPWKPIYWRGIHILKLLSCQSIVFKLGIIS